MMAKRKCDLRKTSIKRPKKASKSQHLPNVDLHCSQNEEEVCEIGWDSPKPLSGQNSDTTVADIVAHLTRGVAGPVLSPPLQLQYTSPQTNIDTETTPSKTTLHGLRRQPKAKQLSFNNQAIMHKVMAVINEYKPKVDEVNPKSACAKDEHLTSDIHLADPPAVIRTSAPMCVNESMDDLWADEDESLIYATLRDTEFPEPSIDSASHWKTHTTEVDNITTSTPNLRPRTSRLTFRLDPPSAECVQKSTTHVKKKPSLLSPSTSLSDTQFHGKRLSAAMSCADVLVKLAEPDEVLDSLHYTKSDSAVSKSNCSNKSSLEINVHDSFLGDNDILDSPELAAVLEEVEFRATQGLSLAPKSSSMGSALATCQSSVSLRSNAMSTQQCDSLKRPNPTGTQNCDALNRPNAIKPPVNNGSGLPVKKLYSVDEIERKRQEAMQRRTKALVKSYR